MDPINFILWTGVAVFAAACLIAVLNLAGIIRSPHQKLLIGTLVTGIVGAGGSAFAYKIKQQSESELRLPVSKLMIVEQAYRAVVFDGTTAIYLRSPDVSRANRFAELLFDLREDFTSAVRAKIPADAPQVMTIGGRKYRVAFSQMGQLDSDPKEPQAPTGDFVFLSIERAE